MSDYKHIYSTWIVVQIKHSPAVWHFTLLSDALIQMKLISVNIHLIANCGYPNEPKCLCQNKMYVWGFMGWNVPAEYNHRTLLLEYLFDSLHRLTATLHSSISLYVFNNIGFLSYFFLLTFLCGYITIPHQCSDISFGYPLCFITGLVWANSKARQFRGQSRRLACNRTVAAMLKE